MHPWGIERKTKTRKVEQEAQRTFLSRDAYDFPPRCKDLFEVFCNTCVTWERKKKEKKKGAQLLDRDSAAKVYTRRQKSVQPAAQRGKWTRTANVHIYTLLSGPHIDCGGWRAWLQPQRHCVHGVSVSTHYNLMQISLAQFKVWLSWR